jgi:hypothetical protein
MSAVPTWRLSPIALEICNPISFDPRRSGFGDDHDPVPSFAVIRNTLRILEFARVSLRFLEYLARMRELPRHQFRFHEETASPNGGLRHPFLEEM